MPQPEPTLAPPPEAVPFVPDPRAELPAGAEAIVVGAGMVGASAAYHLARAGVRPLVIEANSPAWGASGRNAGMALAGLGGHFARVTSLVREAGGRSILDYTRRSLDMLEAWDAELPGGIEWDRFESGAVLLATSAWTPALAPHLGANLRPIRETVCATDPGRYVDATHAPTWLEPHCGIPR